MHKQRIFQYTSISLSAFAVWVYIILQIQPNTSDLFLMIAFYVSFITWLGSALALVFYQMKVRRGNREIIYAHIPSSIRQGFIISGTLGLLLLLQMLRVLSPWEAGLVIVVAIIFELALRENMPTAKGKL